MSPKLNIVLFLVSAFTTMPSNAGIYVGNGGDAVVMQNGLCLVDLYKDGKCLDPYFGVHAQESFVFLRYDGIAELVHTKDLKNLLTKKYLDLELIHPGLGRNFLQAIYSFGWKFVPKLDGPTQDSGTDSVLPIVRIAVRRGKVIYIQSNLWTKLSDEQKVVLIFHEVISSLQKLVPDPSNPALRIVDLQMNRTITFDLFSSTSTQNFLHSLQANTMNLNWLFFNNWIRVDLIDNETDQLLQTHYQGPSNAPFEYPHLRLFAQGVCNEAVTFGKNSRIKIRLRSAYQSRNFAYRRYCSTFGSQYQIEALQPIFSDLIYRMRILDCSVDLARILEEKLPQDMQSVVIDDESWNSCARNPESI